jgi:CheY-specific phosphatase CheX
VLQADKVNAILNAFYAQIEGRLPKLAPLSIDPPELAPSGTFGSFIQGALFSGSFEGKLTFILDWDLALNIASDILQHPVDAPDEETLGALQALFYSSMQSVSAVFAEQGTPVEIPPMRDACALLAEDTETPTLKLALKSQAGVMQLFLAFK